ncbi:hypothetical protein SteCoe_28292 [Stentor coeruleus]|uniref:Importin subunit alpha n=1 Tax=Stentor coeruleus TaxID=5963 RepID=A0A1R2B8H9_9CILI|nr:hypothetical protein SteCoe_28292 [Stentor coeruleus]
MDFPLYTEDRILHRNKEFLSCFNTESHKASREQFSIELRKQCRRKFIEVKRAQMYKEHPMPEELKQYQNIFSGSDDDSIPLYISLIDKNRTSFPIKIFCVQRLCKISNDKKKIMTIYLYGIIKIIIEIIKTEDLQLVQACLWLMINLATGNEKICEDMAKNGVVGICVEIIKRNLKGISEDAVWCLANLTANNPFVCMQIITSEAIWVIGTCIEKLLFPNSDKTYWIIAHITKNIDSLDLLLYSIKWSTIGLNSNTKLPSLCILFSITKKNPDLILQSPGLLRTIIEISIKDHDTIGLTAIKVLGNIAFGNENHTQALLDNQILNCLSKNISSINLNIKKESLLLLYNLLASEMSQVYQVLACYDIKTLMLEATLHKAFDIRFEAWHCLRLITCKLGPNECDIHKDIIFYVSRGLNIEIDPKILELILSAVENILQKSEEKVYVFKELIETSGCLEGLGKLRNHGNSSIQEYSDRIVNTFYDFNELYGIPDDEENQQQFLEPVENYDFS